MAGADGRTSRPLNRQGVTSFLDAVGPEEDITAFLRLHARPAS